MRLEVDKGMKEGNGGRGWRKEVGKGVEAGVGGNDGGRD